MIQILLDIFICIFGVTIAMLLYHQAVFFSFRLEMKKADPDKHPIIQLWHNTYGDSKEPLARMGIFSRLVKLKKEINRAFPTGQTALDKSYSNLKKAEKTLVLSFAVLLAYTLIFVIMLIVFYRDK